MNHTKKVKRVVLGVYDMQPPIPVENWHFTMNKKKEPQPMVMKIMFPISLYQKKIKLIAEIL